MTPGRHAQLSVAVLSLAGLEALNLDSGFLVRSRLETDYNSMLSVSAVPTSKPAVLRLRER